MSLAASRPISRLPLPHSADRRQALTRYRQQHAGHISVQLFSAANGLGVEELLAVLKGWLHGDSPPEEQSLD